MTGDAEAWLSKARSDLDMVRRARAPMPNINLEAAAYHLQQAAEKALKSPLVHLGIAYPRGRGDGHDISVIAAKIPASHTFYTDAQALVPLTPWATAYRYPADDLFAAPDLPLASK